MSGTRFALACILLLLCGCAFGQNVPSKPEVTFKSNSRLVVVDVVVTDTHGDPITGLTRDDFTVMEDGKPQVVQAFDAHTALPATQALLTPVAATTLPNEYSNAPIVAVQGPINILVLDMLNTEITNQSEVRQHTLRFLKQMPPGQLLTVFTLGQQLRMLQGATGDSSELTAAVEKVLPFKSALLKTDDDRASDQEQVDEAAAVSPKVAERVAQAICVEQVNQIDNRVEMTLGALQEMTRVLAAYPAGCPSVLIRATSFLNSSKSSTNSGTTRKNCVTQGPCWPRPKWPCTPWTCVDWNLFRHRQACFLLRVAGYRKRSGAPVWTFMLR